MDRRYEDVPVRPFPDSEYADRVKRVANELARRDLDVLYVNSPANLRWLTGFWSVWVSQRSPLGVAIDREGTTVFYDYGRHRRLVEEVARVDDIVIYDYDDAFDKIAADFERRGWHSGSVGIEDWSWSPSEVTRARLREAVAGTGARVVDGSWLVDGLRLIKSPREVEVVLEAADILNGALEEIANYMRPGVTQIELAGQMNLLLAQRNGEPGAIPIGIESDHKGTAHFPPNRQRLNQGDTVGLDACGVVHGYHVNAMRTYSLGPNDKSAEVLEVTARSIELLTSRIEIGMPLTEAQRIADEYIEQAGLTEYAWWVGGYNLGISSPPDWTGHVYLDGEAHDAPNYQAGLVHNYENVFSSLEEEWSASYIDSLLMTEDGLQILTTYPRTLTVV